MAFAGRIVAALRRHGRAVAAAVAIATVLVAADYLASNFSFPVLDSANTLAPVAYILPDGDTDTCFMAANVAYDKELVSVYDEYGDSIGVTPVTCRATLLRLLRLLADADYRYIYIDVRFDDGLATDADSALFATMAAMPRLAYSTHRADDEYTPDVRAPQAKAAYADYRHIRTDGFSCYEFRQDGCESAALRMYRELCGGDVVPCGIGYTDGGRLCFNSRYVPFPAYAAGSYGPDDEVLYPYLGGSLFAKYTDDELRHMAAGKIVLIGDFDGDRHQSVVGDLPGPMIAYYAYRLLERGGHRVNRWLYGAMWLLYAAIAYALLADVKILRFSRHLWLTIILSLAGWGAILMVVQVIVFATCGIAFSVVLPSLTFSAISTGLQIRADVVNNMNINQM